jgi:hypothetical protein
MYRMVIDRYEDKLKALTTENNDLRHSLKELQQELQDLLNTHNITIFSTNNVMLIKHYYIYICSRKMT